MIRRFAILALLPLAGCVDLSSGAGVGSGAPSPFLGGVAYAPIAEAPARRANADMAQDFVDLVFSNEQGERRMGLARWSGPARVSLAGAFAAEGPFLDGYLADLSRLTGLEIRRAEPLESAEIVIRALPPGRLEGASPGALCGSQHDGDWRSLPAFTAARIDIPAGAAPEDARSCLVEEIAQLLGPVNDLDRLPDSMFNDDGAYERLTGFDRLMLTTLYAPELRPGMSAPEAAFAARRALDRLNPAGLSGAPSYAEAPGWRFAYKTAAQARARGDGPGLRAGLQRLRAESMALAPTDPRRVTALLGEAAAALDQGDGAGGRALANEALTLARASGDEPRARRALRLLGAIR